ncbi:MAG: hypothetical protein IJ629_02955 [Clostridia bacterium]|nr:hypothetical protein [Clostridia bacterium]
MKKKFLILSLLMMLIIALLPVTATAANYSFNTTMSKKPEGKIVSGNEVLITVSLSQLNVGENGINSFSAYLSYDTNVFETLTDSSVDGVNGWVPSYATGTGKVLLHRPTFLKGDEEIMQISLKTKAGLADGTQGEVKLSTIIVSNSSDEIMSSPVSTMVTIGTETAADPVQTNPNANVTPIQVEPGNIVPTPIPVNNTTPVNNTLIVPVNNTTPVNNTVPQNNAIRVVNESGDDMPYTGTDSNALARIIIGVIFISLVIYIKIERMNKDIK